MHWRVLVIAASLIVSLGCNSIRTTVLDRAPGGNLQKNPGRPIKGVPVMLRVPTHLDVKIVQIDYWKTTDAGLEQIGVEMPVRHIDTRIMETEKMFFVDPKRVASGTGIYGFTFDSAATDSQNSGKGYLSGVSYEAVDTTLEKSAELATNIARLFAGQATTAGQELAKETGVITTERTIAFHKFNINSPNIENEVRKFCNDYLNDCHVSCCTNPNYPPSSCQTENP